jgi:hypothetical protein
MAVPHEVTCRNATRSFNTAGSPRPSIRTTWLLRLGQKAGETMRHHDPDQQLVDVGGHRPCDGGDDRGALL